jgi:DNA-binding CsgD family transcriptional regulator
VRLDSLSCAEWTTSPRGACEAWALNAGASGGEVLDPPTPAELAVLRLLASELSVRQIGGQLFLSPNTVRSQTRSIYRKLGVNSRADAVARAETLGPLRTAESPM